MAPADGDRNGRQNADHDKADRGSNDRNSWSRVRDGQDRENFEAADGMAGRCACRKSYP
jgi:hypothetical protein